MAHFQLKPIRRSEEGRRRLREEEDERRRKKLRQEQRRMKAQCRRGKHQFHARKYCPFLPCYHCRNRRHTLAKCPRWLSEDTQRREYSVLSGRQNSRHCGQAMAQVEPELLELQEKDLTPQKCM